MPKNFRGYSMCVCYQLELPFKDIAKTFKTKAPKMRMTWDPKERIRPSNLVPVVTVDPETGERVLTLMTWGMPLFNFEKKKMVKHQVFNARAETITEKKTFKGHFQKDRILVPAYPAFIEWKDTGAKKKQPYQIGLKSGEPFAFAGIWGKWTLTVEDDKTIEEKTKVNPKYVPEKREFELYTIITTTPNSLVSKIHDRMPVILDPKNYDAWLDPKIEDAGILRALLKPFPAEKMEAKPLEVS
jgi:putative SOS response-associated peptidase YedK